MTPVPFELSTQDAVAWLRDLPGGIGRSRDHRSRLRVAREAPRRRDDDAAEAQQGVEQRLVHDLSRTRASASCSPRSTACSSATRTSTCSATRRRCSSPSREAEQAGLQVLEAARLGQAHDRHGLPLPRALRVHPVLREGQAAAERSRHRRTSSRVPRIRGGYPAEKPAEVCRGPDRPEHAARARSWPIRSWARAASASRRHGWAPVPRQRSESRGGARSPRSGCGEFGAPGRSAAGDRLAASPISPTCWTLDRTTRAMTGAEYANLVAVLRLQALRRRAG